MSDHAPSVAAPQPPVLAAMDAVHANWPNDRPHIPGCSEVQIAVGEAVRAALRAESVAAPARPCECGHEWFGHGESGVSQGCYAKGCICREARPPWASVVREAEERARHAPPALDAAEVQQAVADVWMVAEHLGYGITTTSAWERLETVAGLVRVGDGFKLRAATPASGEPARPQEPVR